MLLGALSRSTDGSVAERGTRPARSASDGAGAPVEELGTVTGDSNDNARVWEPWNTRRPLEEIEVPAVAAARMLLRRSNSRLSRSCDTDELPTELILCSRRCELELSGPATSGDRIGCICSAWWLISARFLDFSDNAHCFFSEVKSVSARCSSSRSSMTLRSWEAIARRKSWLSSGTSKGMGVPGGRAGEGRAEDCVIGVIDPGEGALGSVAGAGDRIGGMLMGTFKVKRLVCRAEAWARGGSDDRFCCKSDEERESVDLEDSEANSG